MPLLDNDFVAPRDSDEEGDNAQRPTQSDDVPGADNLQIHDNEVCVIWTTCVYILVHHV